MTLERVRSGNSANVGTESALLPSDTRGQAQADLKAELGQRRVGGFQRLCYPFSYLWGQVTSVRVCHRLSSG